MDANGTYSDFSCYDAEHQIPNPLFRLNDQFTTQKN